MNEAIKKAIEGGYDKMKCVPPWKHSDTLLDPSFWQSLGKALGWDLWECDHCRTKYEGMTWCPNCKKGGASRIGWDKYWHRLVDHLADGGDADGFFNGLIK